MQQKGGRVSPIKGLDDAVKERPKPHGLQNTVNPLETHTVMIVERIPTEKDALKLMLVQILHSGKDGGRPLKN